MEKEFWLDKWKNETEHGFHKDAFHGQLVEFFPKLNIPTNSNILVPLCGKTIDMLWLREQGYQVIGVELSPIAGRAFFEENDLAYEHEVLENFEVFKSKDITIYCGDFFEIQRDMLPEINGIYDRAALVALPPEMRLNYYRKLNQLLSIKGEILFLTFEYDQNKVQGPPFSVTRDEIQEHMPDFHVKELAQSSIEIKSKKFVEVGATEVKEYTLHLSPVN